MKLHRLRQRLLAELPQQEVHWPALPDSPWPKDDHWAARLWAWQSFRKEPAWVVLEWPADRSLLEQLIGRLGASLRLILLDWSGQLSPIPSTSGWFQRREEVPPFAWSCWLDPWHYGGSQSLEGDLQPLLQALEESTRSSWIHVYGQEEIDTPSLPAARPLLSPSDSLEQAFLEQLPQVLAQRTLLWASHAVAPAGAYRCAPEQAGACLEALTLEGRSVLLVLSAGELGEALSGLLAGLPASTLLLVIETGLLWDSEETVLAPSRWRDLALLRQIHGLALTVPADLAEAMHLCKWSEQVETPVAVRLSSMPVVAGLGQSPLEPGRARCLRSGRDASILALGPCVYAALLAAESLSAWGVECQVWEVRFLKPIDRQCLEQIADTGHLVTVEEHCLQGGLATTALETLSLMQRQVRSLHLALPSSPPISRDSLPEDFGLDAEGIVRAMRELLGLAAHFE